jgi:hypothetical protein
VRPKTIVYFEWIMFGTLLLNVLQVYLGWDAIVQVATLGPKRSVAITLIPFIFIFGLIGTLTLLVSRRRSKIAMWVLIAMFVLAVLSLIRSLTELGSNIIVALQSIVSNRLNIIVALQIVGKGAAVGLIFTPSARRWMNREDEKPQLHDVFD